MRLLLINPRFPESFWSLKWLLDNVHTGCRAMNPPLGLATLAALCPPDWDVTIVDENIEVIPFSTDADIVGVCGMGVQFERQRELLAHFRRAGHVVVAGGSYASLCPEAYEGLADVVVAGEAEYVWRRFCADVEAGSFQPLYRETGVVELRDSPVPRFDLLRLDRYRLAPIQFSRGCPFRCEFCDIIVMFGRKPRTKTPEQVERELDAIYAAGARDIFFVDDNFIGNKQLAGELLDHLVAYQRRRGYPFHFGTEASIDLAREPRLLARMQEANFGWVFIGIETPNEESLKETKKHQNTREDMLSSVRRIYDFGINVHAGFIVGFDHDGPETFEAQRRFIMDSGIPVAMISPLTAIPKTPLYERLEREGRLLSGAEERSFNTRLYTNIVPKGMSYEALIEGYRDLYLGLFSDQAIAERVRIKGRYLAGRRRGGSAVESWRKARVARMARVLACFLWRGVLPGGLSRARAVVGSLDLSSPDGLHALSEWVLGLTIRHFLDRYFVRSQRDLDAWVADVRAALVRHPASDAVEASGERQPGRPEQLSIRIRDRRGLGVLLAEERLLAAFLAETPFDLALDLRGIGRADRALTSFFDRLARYSTRVSVAAADALLRDERCRMWRFVIRLPEAPRPEAPRPEASPAREHAKAADGPLIRPEDLVRSHTSQ